ncbi:MAG: PHP domain-containing protein [Vicinamibacterales bacterium]
MSGPSPIARTLNALADLSEIRGETSVAAAYRRAAAFIAALSSPAATDLLQRARQDRLDDDAAIDPRIRRRLRELAVAGEDTVVVSARAALPRLFKALLALSVVDTNEAALLVKRLGILTLGDLQHALEIGRVVQTFDQSLDARLRQAAPAIGTDAAWVPLGRARDVLESLSAAIMASSPTLEGLLPSGDVRRFESLVAELLLVGRSVDPLRAIEQLCAARGIDDVLHRGPRRVLVANQGTEVDIRVAAPDEYGTVLFTTTGSRSHLQAMRSRGGHLRLVQREEDVYSHAGLPYIPPELRQGTGEVEAAAGTLPHLVSTEHMRGDLHMHTIYSDGADTLDAMVAGSCALGYEYIAITDHSERAGASRTLTVPDISRQRAEIEAARERYPHMTILHGIEVDIMPDGRLDFPDSVLESLDIVLASLHESAGHDGKTLTRRCLQAIRHPLVTVIAHPANRLVGRRAGYPLDYDAIFAAAAETGTALEVDGAASHLDLEGERAREAIAAGVTLTIDSDCHRAKWLERQMNMGVGTARRGWVEPRHVLNTRSIADVRAFIMAKRRR